MTPKPFAPRTLTPIHAAGDRICHDAQCELTKYASNAMSRRRYRHERDRALCEKIGAKRKQCATRRRFEIRQPRLFPARLWGSVSPRSPRGFTWAKAAASTSARFEHPEVIACERILSGRAQSEFGEFLDGKAFAVWGLASSPARRHARARAIDIVEGLSRRGAGTATTRSARARRRIRRSRRARPGFYRILEGADGVFLGPSGTVRSRISSDLASRGTILSMPNMETSLVRRWVHVHGIGVYRTASMPHIVERCRSRAMYDNVS